MVFIRSVNMNDLDDLMGLSDCVDRGMTNIPLTEERWAELVEESTNSFAALFNNKPISRGVYLIALVEGGKIIGTSAIFSPIGVKRPFYNYRVTKYSNLSPELNKRIDGELLHLVNDYNGAVEVGSLFLHPDYRGRGRGRFLSFSRFMIIASYYDYFPELVMAEIRGWEDEKGVMPFWEAVGAKFFNMSFDDADKLSVHDFRFIADLVPRIPVYMSLLPLSAQNAVAKPNKGAEGAYVMLSKLGFKYNGLVDILDAGPCLDTPKGNISIIKNLYQAELKVIDDDEITNLEKKDQCLIGIKNGGDFKTLIGYAEKNNFESVAISESHANEATLKSQQKILAVKVGNI